MQPVHILRGERKGLYELLELRQRNMSGIRFDGIDHGTTVRVPFTDTIRILEEAIHAGQLLLRKPCPQAVRIAECGYAALCADPGTGQDRNTWSWREDLRSRPTQRWTLDGSIGYSLTETPLNDRLLERQYWSLRSAWSPGAHLFLDGALYWSRDNELTSTSQVFGLSYIPGPKLIVNLSHRETSTDTGRKTSGDSLSANYRLHPRVQLSGSWNRSKVSLSGDLTSQTDSLLVGFSIFFY